MLCIAALLFKLQLFYNLLFHAQMRVREEERISMLNKKTIGAFVAAATLLRSQVLVVIRLVKLGIMIMMLFSLLIKSLDFGLYIRRKKRMLLGQTIQKLLMVRLKALLVS